MRDFALGLAAHGFRRGDKLAVIGDNRPRLYWAQLAAQGLGGIAVPMYQDAIASEMVYVLNHAEIRVVVAEDQEQVDKILSLKAQLPHLDLVVYDDPRGMRRYPTPALEPFERVQAKGREFGAAHPGYVDGATDKGTAEDVAMMAYTSGTTGEPKGVMLCHANLLAAAEGFVAAEDIRPSDDSLSYLPMAWVGDVAVFVGACTGRRRYLQLPGEPGNSPARSARTRPNGGSGAAANLGKHADPDAGAGGRRDADSSGGPSSISAASPSGSKLPAAPAKAVIAAALLAWRSASSWSTGRCATSSACATPAGPIPEARRSAPTRIRFFRSFGVNLKQI